MYFRLTVLLALFLGFLGDAAATSCRPLDSRYLYACDAARCTGLFSVTDVPAARGCARLAQVEEIDPRIGARAARLVEAGRPPASAGILELKMTRRYWGNEAADPSAWFDDHLGSAVTLISTDASAAAIAGLRARFESAQRAAYWKAAWFSIVYWGSSALMMLALIHSVHMYFKVLYSAVTPRRWRPLLLPVTVQLAVGGGAMAVLWRLFAGEFWPGIVLVPVVPVILVCEGWALFLQLRGAKRSAAASA